MKHKVSLSIQFIALVIIWVIAFARNIALNGH